MKHYIKDGEIYVEQDGNWFVLHDLTDRVNKMAIEVNGSFAEQLDPLKSYGPQRTLSDDAVRVCQQLFLEKLAELFGKGLE